MINIAKRIMKQITHDKRSLGMILIVPLFLLTLLYLLLGKSSYVPTVMPDGLPQPFVSALEGIDTIKIVEKNVTVDHTGDFTNDYKDILKNGYADAVITQGSDGIHVIMLETDNVKLSAVTNAVKEVSAQLNPQGQMSFDFIYGNTDESMCDSLGLLLLGILSFFMIFLFSGISFVRERTSDTVERLMLTPVRTVSVVGGYVLGFGVFAIIQSALMIVFAKFVLKMPFVGQWWCAMIIMLLIAVIAVVFGVMISAVSKNEFQVMQFIPIVIIPQIFFSGLIPVDTLPYHLNYISKIMPLYYGSTALKGVLVYGYSLAQILPQILILCGFIVLLFAINIIAVRKYRAV